MRTIKFILPALLIILSISSCRKEPFGIWGKGNNVTEVRNVTGFTGIDLAMSATVYYHQDSVYWVEISAQPNIMKYIETQVHGNTLEIDCRPNLHSHNSIVVIVHSPQMNLLHVSGSGDIYAKTSITTTSMDVSLSGSGNISIPSLSAQNLKTKISGSGDIDIEGGSVSDEDFSVSGSGNIDVVNVISNTSEVNISGSGDMQLSVIQSLKVEISGSGTVKYKGNPGVETHISGSGDVIHIN